MSTRALPLPKSRRKPVNSYVLVIALAVLVYYTLVGVWPFFYNIYLSFRKTDLITEDKFIGLANYSYMLTDPLFWKSFWHNFYYLGVMVSLGLVTSLIFAALIYRTQGIIRKVYVAMFFAPVVTSIVAVSLVWTLLYFPKIGILAQILSRLFGINPNNLTFLHSTSTALLCIMIMDVWRDTGIRTVILLAGMDEIPDSLYESARMDGAGTLKQFFRITLPLLTPQLVFIAAVYSINALRVYAPIYMMTGSPAGGPAHSTMVLTLHMYLSAFYGQRFGYGSTISIVIFVILFGLVLLEIRAFQQKWEY